MDLASGVDIKNKGGNLTAPTPQNTPINPAPITSSYRPSIPAISEDMETINAAGKYSLIHSYMCIYLYILTIILHTYNRLRW